MSDARALLRQQRAARRITHPHAAYSDTGKLLCTLCREQVKAENLWDAHLQSPSHRKRAETASPPQRSKEEADEEKEATVVPAAAPTSHKRKIDDDEAMGDADDTVEALTRRKRSRPDLGRDSTEEGTSKDRSLSIASNGFNGMKDQDQTLTPPSLTRRSSATPSQGVEVQIPSRPATPRESTTNSASTTRTLPSRQASTIALQGQPVSSTTPTSLNGQPGKPPPTAGDDSSKKAGDVDEDEWAAFEADIAAATYDEADATISAPAMTAAESEAAKAAEEDDGDPRRRTSKPEADLADEREDARRAFEEELDEMHSLEAKVLKFKEQRDALRRRRAESQGQQDAEEGQKKAKDLLGKENTGNSVAVVEEDEEEEDEDEDDEDDWDGFRFRTGVAR